MDQSTLVYNGFARGVTSAALAARMAAVPLPRDVLVGLGLRVTSDLTAAGNPATRTVVLAFGPSVVATAVPVISNEGRVLSVTVTAPGIDYILPPNVTIVDPNRRPFPPSIQSHTDGLPPGGPDSAVGNKVTFQSRLKVMDSVQVAGGAGYVAPSVAFVGGLPPAGKLGLVPEARIGGTNLTLPPTGAQVLGCVKAVNLVDGGISYPANTQVFFEGGIDDTNAFSIRATGVPVISATGRILDVIITNMGRGYTSTPQVVFRSPTPTIQNPPRRIATAFASMAVGNPAQATANLAAGVIATLTITEAGFNYVEPPDIVITDSSGSGAIFTPCMGLGVVNVVCPGRGYTPGLTSADTPITPAFKTNFPDVSDQSVPFFKLFEALIKQAAFSPIISNAPVLA